MKYNVLMTDTIFPDTGIEEEVFRQGEVAFKLSSASDAKTLAEQGQEADALLVVYAPVTSEIIDSLPNCKAIIRAGIGYNNVDLDAANRRGIKVANVPDYCQDEVADHTLALLLALARRLCQLQNSICEGNWDANLGREAPRLEGKTLGLLGCGAIGLAVAKRASAFGLKVVGYDPYTTPGTLEKNNIERAENFDTFIANVDFLSLHLPLTEESRHIIDAAVLKRMKSTAQVINTSRGGLIQEEDLYQALTTGEIAGAALDVLECEPPEGVPKLAVLDNTIMTPHTAFLSASSVDELRMKASLEVVRTLKEGKPKHQVN
ncbi:MAG: C-terminal binding protein [Saccharospirillum sp.]|nr:C-terminal binding protein [Saccharospirillum sp.]